MDALGGSWFESGSFPANAETYTLLYTIYMYSSNTTLLVVKGVLTQQKRLRHESLLHARGFGRVRGPILWC